MEPEPLVIPQANAVEEVGKLIMDLPKLWANANSEERRKLLLTMLDVVYVDARYMDIIIDTNILRQDHLLRSHRFQVVLDYLQKTSSHLVIPT